MNLVSPPPYRIYLLRHAKSDWAKPGERDFDRALSNSGFAEAETVAVTASSKAYRPDLVISSTALRCRQTADAIRRNMPGSVPFRFLDELYNAPADTYFDVLSALDGVGSVMLIGHNPAMEEVLETLVGTAALQAAIPEGYPTAGLAVLDHATDSPAGSAKSWRLTDFLTH